MAGMLDLSSIEQFSVPLGRVVLQYSNLDAALTEFLVQALGFDDWRECDAEAGPDIPLENRVKLFWKLYGKSSQHKPWPSAKRAILTVKPAIDKRHNIVHGQWWMKLETEEVMTRYFPKCADQPEHRSWTPGEVHSVARDLEDAASELEASAYQLRRASDSGAQNG